MFDVSFLKNINWRSSNVKLAILFVTTFIVALVITPGLFFELGQDNKNKRKISIKTGAIHSVILSVFVSLLYYFYIRK